MKLNIPLNADSRSSKIFWQFFYLLGGLSALFIIVINFYSLQFNLIPSDEGWYICLLRDMPVFGSTRFHLLFGGLLTDDIYVNRIICLLFRIIGTVVFSLGFGTYLNIKTNVSKKLGIAASFVAIWIGYACIDACPSFNYINTNCALAEIAVGLLLLGVFKSSNLCVLLSGFAAFAIIPIMATNSVLILCMCAFIFLLSDKRWVKCLWFLSGGVLFFCFYLSFIESPQDVWNFFISESQKAVTDTSGAYNVFFFVKWSVKSFLYLARCFVIALVLYYVNRAIEKNWYIKNHAFVSRIIKILTLCILLVCSLRFLPPFVPFIKFGVLMWINDIMWIALFLLAQYDYHIRKWELGRVCIVLLLAGAPFLLSLGTNVEFNVRATGYYSFVFPLFVLFTVDHGTEKNRMLFGAVLILKMVNFIFLCLGNNWCGESFISNEKISLRTIGIEQDVWLDSHYIEELKECRRIVPDGAAVLCSHVHWIDAALSDYKLISYEFDIRRKEKVFIQKMIEGSLAEHEELWILSTTRGSGYLNDCVETLDPCLYNFNKYVDGTMCYYRVTELR